MGVYKFVHMSAYVCVYGYMNMCVYVCFCVYNGVYVSVFENDRLCECV